MSLADDGDQVRFAIGAAHTTGLPPSAATTDARWSLMMLRHYA